MAAAGILLPLLKTLDPEPPVIVLSGADPTQAQRSAVASALLKTTHVQSRSIGYTQSTAGEETIGWR